MSTEKSLAIVIRTVDFSETSCVATLFTRDFGKITAMAKGARRPKSAFEAALDLLAVCRIVFLHKSSDALDLLTEAKLQRRFRAERTSLSCLYAGYYVAELLRELTDEADPHPELFDLAEATLAALGKGEDAAPRLLRFETMALIHLGHAPSLYECVECGSTVPAADSMAFGLSIGGVLCEQHRVGKRHIVRLSRQALETMRRFARPSDQWRETGGGTSASGEVRAVMNQYISHLLGKRPRMHDFLAKGLLPGDQGKRRR